MNPKGAAHGSAKLTEADVREIREFLSQGRLTQREIGARFGVAQSNIAQINLGHIWSSTSTERQGNGCQQV